ncbi:MAG: TolC family protein [Prevotella sp.]|jgi:outer membrane protein|nr:TolC family protein [Prevotella sp.]MCI1281141.1 TolC family protein [Prevotella sp.]
MNFRLVFWGLIVFGGMPVSLQAQTDYPMNKEQLFQLLEANSKVLKVSKTGMEVARQGVEMAKNQRLPDVNASLSMSYIGNALLSKRDFSEMKGLSSSHLGNDFALEARQTVYAGGAVNAGIRKAQLAEQQAGVSMEALREQQRFLVLGQYLELCKIDHRIEVVKQNIGLTEQVIRNVESRFRQGVVLKNDVTRYELQRQTLTLDLTELEDSRKVINHQLCNALGLTADRNIRPEDDVAALSFAKDGEGHWQGLATMTSPSMKLSVLDEQQAREDLKLAKAERLPKVALTAADNLTGPITYELPPVNKNINVWYIGVGVSYPLSALYKSRQKVRQQAQLLRQREEQTLVTGEELNNQMQQAYTDYLQAYVALQTQQKKVELAKENYQVVNDRYLNQLALITDMTDASNMRLDAELQEVDARINIAYTYYKMQYIAGNL